LKTASKWALKFPTDFYTEFYTGMKSRNDLKASKSGEYWYWNKIIEAITKKMICCVSYLDLFRETIFFIAAVALGF
jgi:hypothetical protein